MTVHGTRPWRDNLKGLGKFVLLLFGRRAAWGYIHLARIGLGLVGLGVSLLIPGIWETILNWFLPRLGISDPETKVETLFAAHTVIACVIIAAGLLLTSWCFWLYHRLVTTSGPSRENDDKLTAIVQPGTTVRALIAAVAIEHEKAVDVSALSETELSREISPGRLAADDFDDFLNQVAARAVPSLSLEWSVDAKVYKLHTTRP